MLNTITKYVKTTIVFLAVYGAYTSYVGVQEWLKNPLSFIQPAPPPSMMEKTRITIEDWSQRVLELNWFEWTVISAVVLFCALVYFRGRRTVHSIRGIRQEAMKPGSAFVSGKPLKCQVQIKLPGLLIDSHNGYGFRLGDYLVAPTHVVWEHDEVLLQGPRGKYLITLPDMKKSKGITDVCYTLLPESLWANIGVSTVSIDTSAEQVTIHGQKGTSTGYLRKTNVLGQYSYTGSTVPGMSGSLYASQGKAIAMHMGANAINNLGVSLAMIQVDLHRLQKVFRPESSDEQVYSNTDFTNQGGWQTTQLNGYMDDVYSQSQDEMDRLFEKEREVLAKRTKEIDDYLQSKRSEGTAWADMNEEESCFKSKPKSQARPPPPPRGPFTFDSYKKHSPGQDQIDIPLMDMQILERIKNIEAVLKMKADACLLEAQTQSIINIEERLSHIEIRVDRDQGVKVQKAQHFQCDQCPTTCTTQANLDRHHMASHQVKETKFPCYRCQVVCRTQAKLANHMKAHGSDSYKCPKCFAVHDDPIQSQNHIIACFSSKPVEVPYAPESAHEPIKENVEQSQPAPEVKGMPLSQIAQTTAFLEQRKKSRTNLDPTSRLLVEQIPSTSNTGKVYKSTTELTKKTRKD